MIKQKQKEKVGNWGIPLPKAPAQGETGIKSYLNRKEKEESVEENGYESMLRWRWLY